MEKTNFTFICRWQLQIASWLGMRTSIHLTLLVHGPHLSRTCAGLLHVANVSEFMCFNLMSARQFLWGNISTLALKFIPSPLPHGSLSLEGRALMKKFHLGLSTPKFLTLFTLSTCGSLLVPF